jgi:peptidoglycan/xylan/chitin deacetylase (PgdA/CDA1 family)
MEILDIAWRSMKKKLKKFCLYFLITLLFFVEAAGIVPVNAKANKTAFEKQIITTNFQNKLDEGISNSVIQAEGDLQTNLALLSKSILPYSDKTTRDRTTKSYTVTITRAQAWTSTHQITYFQGNKPGAISISFDDGLPYQAQDTNGVSQLNARGLKGTFFVVTEWVDPYWRDSWPTWQSVAAQGHEIASHTVTHSRLTTLSDNEVRWELSKSQSDINQNIPGKNAISLSYPNTAENSTIDAIAGDYYVASRVEWAKEGEYLNYYQPFADEYGSYKTVNFNTVAAMEMDGVSVNDPDFNSRLDRAILNHAWFNLYFHTINDASAFGNVLDYIQGKQAFWIDTFGNVSRYMKERLNSMIQVVTDTPSEIRLQIVMGVSLPKSIYNVPLTVRSTVPASWSQVVMQQGGAIQTITPVIEGSETVIYYNALPNGGDIVLIPLNPDLGLSSLNPTSAFIAGSSFTLTVTGTNFVNGSIVRWNNSDRATTYISATQLNVSIPASDIMSISTAEVRVFNPSPSESTSNQLYFAVTPKPVTVTVVPGQTKTYGGSDPIFSFTSSDPTVSFTGALNRVSGENVGAFTINQGTLAVVDSNYSITSFVPANFAITPKPITITVSPGQSKVYGDADPIFTYTSSDPAATFTGALRRVSGENVGTHAINQGTLAVAGNNYAIASFVSSNFTIVPSTNANLSNLVLSSGSLSPAFVSGTTTYTQSVANAVTSLTVTPTVADATASIKVNGATVASGSASGSISLALGDTVINTVVTAQDGTTIKSYTVTVTRAAPSTNANLSGLAFSAGVLTPAFAPDITAYTQSVAYTVASLTVTPTVTDATASIKVNGATVASGSASGSISLAVGDTIINTVVTAQDGTTTKTYIITITRAPNPAKDITDFSFTSPMATGVITGTNIAVTVPFGTDITALVATFTTTGASVRIGDSTQFSGTTPNNFSSSVTYTVVAADNTKKDYSVSVMVAANPAKAITVFSFASPDATGTINEAAHTITVAVPYGTDVTALVATFTTTGTTVRVGNTTQTSKITANNFTSPLTYTVTAADLTTNDYTVTVTVIPDITTPTIFTILRANADPTSATRVDFKVIFSEDILGVSTVAPFNDFSLTTSSGISGASITSVSGSGATYTVTVNTGNGNGTIRLNVVDDNSIVDLAFNPLGGADVGDGNYMSGEVYTISRPVQDVITDTWAVQVLPSANPSQLATQLGAQNLGQIGSLPGYYLFRVTGSQIQSGPVTTLFSANPQVLWFEQQVARGQSKRNNTEAISPTQVVMTVIAESEIIAFQDNRGDVSAINTLPAASSPEPAQTAITITESFPTTTKPFTAVPTQTNISPITSPIPAQTTITQRPPVSIPTRLVQSAKIAALPNEPSLIPNPMIRSSIPSTESGNRSGTGGTLAAVMITLSLAAGGVFLSMRWKK